jgi:hypothetical protein
MSAGLAEGGAVRALRAARKLGALGSRVVSSSAHFLFGVPSKARRLPRWPWLTRSDETNWGFAVLFGSAYLVYLVWAHVHHEPWRDETHPWIVARQAEGFWDILMGDRRYDGHPPGWYWTLRLATFFTREVWGLHATTIALSFTAAILFLRFAPFARPLRLLLVSGYLLAYEYGVLSRNYTLGIVCAFAFASFLRPLKPRPLALGILLVGLSFSSVYGAILACALSLVLLAESTGLGQKGPPGTLGILVERRALVALVLVLGAVTIALWSSRPPDPNPYAPGVSFGRVDYAGFETSLTRMTFSMLPLREDKDLWYWAMSDQVWRNYPEALRWVKWALLGVTLLCLLPSPVELLAFVLGTVAIMLVQLAVYGGSIRHWGHYFILFLVLCWTSRQRKPLRRGWLTPVVLGVMGLFQCESLVVAARMDQKHIFSGGPEAAAILSRKELAGLPLVGGPDWVMPAVTADLDRDFISCETHERNQTLVFHARRRNCTVSDVLRKATEVSERRDGPVAVVVMGRLPKASAGTKVKLIARTRTPTLSGEDLFIYRVQSAAPAP